MNVFRRSEEETPAGGAWIRRWQKGKPAAACGCPMCGAVLEISDSRILNAGVVEYPVTCSCRWLDFVCLEGWADASS